MSKKQLALWWAVYFLAMLLLNRAMGVDLWLWFVVVAISPFVIALSHRVQKWLIRPQTELEWLTDLIRLERQTERIWIGRTVLLTEDIRNSNEPEGLQVYVQAGTLGKIVALNRDEHAPFLVQFPGFAHKVTVRLEKLDLDPISNRKRTYHPA